MSQVNTSVCMGMGKVGKRRLKLYREGAKARGYKSFSKYVKDVLDRELSLSVPRETHREIRQPVA
jgi:hypothetical protein